MNADPGSGDSRDMRGPLQWPAPRECAVDGEPPAVGPAARKPMATWSAGVVPGSHGAGYRFLRTVENRSLSLFLLIFLPLGEPLTKEKEKGPPLES